MGMVVMAKPAPVTAEAKLVPANQKSIDELALNSGTWRVAGVPGLYLRCRAKSKSFFLQRRVQGKLVKETLGPLTLKQAREKAMKLWSALKPKPAAHEVVTLESAIERYLEDKPLAPKTVESYRYNLEHYLEEWKKRGLHEVGNDRAGFRYLIRQVKKNHGVATSNQVVRLVSAVYRWQRKIDTSLPESPTTAVEVEKIPARDWAYSAEQLRAWWYTREESKSTTPVELGVKTLGPIKRMWWLTALFTGARKGSIESLQWPDLDFEKKTMHFRVTKGDQPYIVPMSDKLAELLIGYRDGGQVPPSNWVFPSPVKEGQHIVGVKNDKEGAGPAHRLRHTFRTTLAELGASPDQARMLMGHSMGGDISRGYISVPLLVESLRPLVNAVAARYLQIAGLD